MIETCKLPLISIKRFPNSDIRLFIVHTVYMLCDIDSLSSKFFVKFVYFEKDTKFEKIFHLEFDAVLSKVKFYVEDFFKFCGLLRISEL